MVPRIIKNNYTKFHRNRTGSFCVIPEQTDRQTDNFFFHTFGFGVGLVTPPAIYFFDIFNVQNFHFYRFIISKDISKQNKKFHPLLVAK